MSVGAGAKSYVTQKLSTAQGWGANQWTAIIIWLIGAWLTSIAIAQLGIPEPINYAFGGGIQWILTRAESPIWKKKGFPVMALGALFVDVLINTAGGWLPLQNLGKTDLWSMINDLLEGKRDPQTPIVEPTQITILVLAAGAGLFTAGAAEYFWNLD